MSFSVTFVGGPLGGQVRAMPEPLQRWVRVPVMPPVDYTSYVSDPPELRVVPWEEEEYELVRSSYLYRSAEYRWVNPADRIRRDRDRLKRELEEVQDFRDALLALKKVAKHL